MNTIEQIVKTVRELSYDRFPVPIIGIKNTTAGATVGVIADVNPARASRLELTLPNVTVEFSTADTFEKLYDEIVGGGVVAAQLAYFRYDEVTENMFYPKPTVVIGDKDIYLVTTSFYSDHTIKLFMLQYLKRVLNKTDAIIDDVDTLLQEIIDSEMGDKILNHLVLYCALWMCDYRRLVEYTILNVPVIYSDGSTTTEGSEPPMQNMFSSLENRGDSINVSIGGIFSMNDEQKDGDNTATQYAGNHSTGSAGLPGTELFFNDENNFWYRYFCWLRDKLEVAYGDFTFRKENGVWGVTTLQKDLNYRTFFDSYPFTLSPTLRGI